MVYAMATLYGNAIATETRKGSMISYYGIYPGTRPETETRNRNGNPEHTQGQPSGQTPEQKPKEINGRSDEI